MTWVRNILAILGFLCLIYYVENNRALFQISAYWWQKAETLRTTIERAENFVKGEPLPKEERDRSE